VLLRGAEDGYDVRRCVFASETRVLCDLRQTGVLPNRSIAFQVFVAVNTDGTEVVRMPQGSEGISCQQDHYLRNHVDRVPDGSGRVIFLNCSAWNPVEVDTHTRRIADVSGANEVGKRYGYQY